MSATRLLALGLLVLASDVSAQSHNEAAPAKTAPAAAAHGVEPAPKATAAKKGPTVSRIVPVATPSPTAAGADHAAPADHSTPADHAAPGDPAPAKPRGYVAVGARPKGAAAAHGASASDKPKPVVSGAAGLRTPATEHAGPATASAKAAADPHAAAHPAAPGAATPAARDVGKKPAKLATVHERLTAALVGIRAGTAHDAGGAGHASDSGAPAASPRAARVALRWPGPRWQVAWPSPGRIALRWPEPAPELPQLPAVPPPHD